MIYRDEPQNSIDWLQQVVLPTETFKTLMAFAWVGEAVSAMKQGWILHYSDGKFYASSVSSNVVFHSESPLEALDMFAEWMNQNGEANHNPS